MCLLTCDAHASGTTHERAHGLRAVEARDGKSGLGISDLRLLSVTPPATSQRGFVAPLALWLPCPPF
jgi:hypothetical protein